MEHHLKINIQKHVNGPIDMIQDKFVPVIVYLIAAINSPFLFFLFLKIIKTKKKPAACHLVVYVCSSLL